MNKDEFIRSKQSTSNPTKNEENNNFFLVNGESSVNSSIPPIQRHLNDYDSNLLKEDAYKEVNDKVLKLEYKISKLENSIKNIDEQIATARDMQDFNTVITLEEDKKQLEYDLSILMDKYKNSSISAKISGGIGNRFKPTITFRARLVNFINDYILSKIPLFASITELRQSLNKLEKINTNVNELMKMQIPYGNIDKYDKLSRYIVHANNIQNEINKILK